MSYFLEKKYITLVSGRVENFHWKSSQLANGRCPICHDSAKSKKKSRLYFINRNDGWHVYCHNCGLSSSFKKFLERIDSQLHSELMTEILLQKGFRDEVEDDFNKYKVPVNTDPQMTALMKLKKISQLKTYHPAKVYIQQRLIPNKWHSEFRWCPNFNKWINDYIIPGKFDPDALNYDEGRIILPFIDDTGHFHCLQGRMLGGEKRLRYIHIVIDHATPPLWGLDKINLKMPVFVFEGIFDALFISNSLAICGGNYNSLISVVNRDNTIIVYDFEQHSLETKKKIRKAIDQGFKVFIPPSELPGKDINELLMGGMDLRDVDRMLRNPFNIHEGLHAITRLAEWSKV